MRFCITPLKIYLIVKFSRFFNYVHYLMMKLGHELHKASKLNKVVLNGTLCRSSYYLVIFFSLRLLYQIKFYKEIRNFEFTKKHQLHQFLFQTWHVWRLLMKSLYSIVPDYLLLICFIMALCHIKPLFNPFGLARKYLFLSLSSPWPLYGLRNTLDVLLIFKLQS